MPLPWPIGSDQFWIAYNVAIAQANKTDVGADLRSRPGTLSAALAAYFSAHQWDALSEGTRNKRRLILERFRERYGQWPLQHMTENFIDAYLNTLKPFAARNHLKALRGFLQHAKHDVTRNIRAPKATSKRHASWPLDVIALYEAHHGIGTKARLCFALARYTGAACVEIARLGPQHVVGDEIIIARQKTGVTATITVQPELRAIIEAMPLTGLTTFLVTRAASRFRQTVFHVSSASGARKRACGPNIICTACGTPWARQSPSKAAPRTKSARSWGMPTRDRRSIIPRTLIARCWRARGWRG